ncbi:MAG: class I SAM-dependent methyltransferase [Anaerolineae bacterium]|nr:class I SAM-dependent methyltransferase [Anaerolineae bacterium]
MAVERGSESSPVRERQPAETSRSALSEIPPVVTLESTTCLLCGQAEVERLFDRQDLATGQPGRFQVVRCLSCDHVYLNPRPTPETIGFYYPASYSPYNQPHPEDMRTPWGKYLANHPLNVRARLVKRYVSGGRILDLGCAEGQFLNQLKRFGQWQRTGLEFNQEAIATAQKRYDFEAIAGSIEVADRWPAASFDVVTMWDVIEHLHQPDRDLERVNRLLKPGGYLILSTPIRGSLEHRLFGKYWVGYELPRHLHIFSRPTLARLLRQTGFDLVERRIIWGSPHAFSDSLAFWARGAGLNPLAQRFIRRSFANKFWALFSPLFFSLFDKLELTTPVTFVFRKTKAES